MIIGYARVPKIEDQDNAAQLQTLITAGAERIFEESASGSRWDRPELQRALDYLREGDVLAVWKLDRLSRSLKDLLSIVNKIEGKGADFKSLTEAIDTTTLAGRMMMKMVGCFAEFERSMIREHTKAGLEHARAKGVKLGRRPQLTSVQRAEVIEMVCSGRKTAAEAARVFNVHPSTISRLLAAAE